VLLARQLLDALREHGVESPDVVRVVDHDVKPGVLVDMGDGDAWPGIRRQLLEADVLVLCTPTWLGQHSSVCQRVLERLDAELSETDEEGRLLTYGKVALVGVVGNEDGAHHITGILQQALGDVGFTFPAQVSVYWNDESAGEHRDYKDLPGTPEHVAATMQGAAARSAHLARLLRGAPYPPA